MWYIDLFIPPNSIRELQKNRNIQQPYHFKHFRILRFHQCADFSHCGSYARTMPTILCLDFLFLRLCCWTNLWHSYQLFSSVYLLFSLPFIKIIAWLIAVPEINPALLREWGDRVRSTVAYFFACELAIQMERPILPFFDEMGLNDLDSLFWCLRLFLLNEIFKHNNIIVMQIDK